MTFTGETPLCLRKGADECLVVRPTEYSRCVAILEMVSMFEDETGVIWANMPVDVPGPRVLPLRSRAMRNFVSQAYCHFMGTPPKDHPIRRAILEHEARATFDNHFRLDHVDHRVRFDDDHTSAVYSDYKSIRIDLADRDHTAIEITGRRAGLVNGSELHWTRPAPSQHLPTPKSPKSVKKLLRRLRYLIRPATDADFDRILVWLSSTLNPNGPRPALILDGPRSATTNIARFLRSILDPSDQWRNDFPTTDHQLRKLVDNNYILVFPGLQRLSPKRAETLCRLVHDYRRSAIVILHRSRPDRPAVADPELERSSFTVRLAEPAPPIEELKLRAHLDRSLPEVLGLLVRATHESLGHHRQARPPRVATLPDTARWVTAAADILDLTNQQIQAALTPDDKKPPLQPQQTKTTSAPNQITSKETPPPQTQPVPATYTPPNPLQTAPIADPARTPPPPTSP